MQQQSFFIRDLPATYSWPMLRDPRLTLGSHLLGRGSLLGRMLAPNVRSEFMREMPCDARTAA